MESVVPWAAILEMFVETSAVLELFLSPIQVMLDTYKTEWKYTFVGLVIPLRLKTVIKPRNQSIN
jgi:hypothetical protein